MVGGCNASLAAPLIPPIPTDPHPSQPPNGNRNDDHTQHNDDHDLFDDNLIIMIIIQPKREARGPEGPAR